MTASVAAGLLDGCSCWLYPRPCAPAFTPRVQDVAPRDAGKLLGLTNSCATLAGVAANVAAGLLGGAAGGFGAMLGLTAALYLASFASFSAWARGCPVQV